MKQAFRSSHIPGTWYTGKKVVSMTVKRKRFNINIGIHYVLSIAEATEMTRSPARDGRLLFYRVVARDEWVALR